MTTAQPIRHVPDTFQLFRYLNPDELVEGTTAWMVDIDRLPSNLDDLRFFGKTEITLDTDPLYTNNRGTPSVYYHCTRPFWEGQCFVPVANMTTGYDRDRDLYRTSVPGPRHEYWVPA